MHISESKRAAGRKGGQKSGEARRRLDPDRPFRGSLADGAQGIPGTPLPPSGDPDVDAKLAAYTKLVGEPLSWPDVKTMEQVRAEIYKTMGEADARSVRTGKLFTLDQVRARDEAAAQVFRERLRTVTDLVVKLAPPERVVAAQKEASEWADGVATAVADELATLGAVAK